MTYSFKVGSGIRYVLNDKCQVLECLDDGHSSATGSTTDVNNLSVAFHCPRIYTKELVIVDISPTGKSHLCALSNIRLNLGKVLKDFQVGAVGKIEGRLVRSVRFPKLRKRQGIPSPAGALANQIEAMSNMRSLSLFTEHSGQGRVCKDIRRDLAKDVTVTEVAHVPSQFVTLNVCLDGNLVDVHLRVPNDVRDVGLDTDEKGGAIMKLGIWSALEQRVA